jgi:transcriptional regulator with XRE-family HTH domain
MKHASVHTLPTNLTFGQEIRRIRRSKEMSQLDLADRVGCAPSTLNALESRVRGVPDFDRALSLVEVLKCDRAEADRLLMKALIERGALEIKLVGVRPHVIELAMEFGRRIKKGLDMATAARIKEVLIGS